MDTPRQDASTLNTAANRLGKGAGVVVDTARSGVGSAMRKGRSFVFDMKLYQAVMRGNLEQVQDALRLGADPNMGMGIGGPSKSRHERPVLAEALIKGHYAVADALIDAGAEAHRTLGKKQNTTLIEYLALKTARVSDKNERQLLQTAEKLLQHGADVCYVRKGGARDTTILHGLARRATMPEMAKLAMRYGALADIRDGENRLPEELLDRSLPKPFQRDMDAMYWSLRQHRLAPCPDIGEDISHKDLTTSNEGGYSALDHWHTWDNYRVMQDALKAQGDTMLSAADLLQPLGGAQGAPTRLEAMLHSCPSLKVHLFDEDLWKGQTVETAKAFYDVLPDALKENAPYYSLRVKLQREARHRQPVQGR